MSEYGGYDGDGGGGGDGGYGGYGGDGGGGGSQQQGGGFNSSSQGSGSGTPSKNKNSGTSTCTIQQVLKAELDQESNKYMIDGFQVGTVALIGEVIDVDEQSTRTKVTLEDGTGSITVTIWNDSANADDGDQSAPKATLGLTKGMWIRTHAGMKGFNGTVQMTSYGVVKDVFNQDFNALTHHYLNTIVESLGKTRGPLGKQSCTGAAAVAAPAVYGQPAAFVAQRSAGAAVVAESSGGANDLAGALKEIFERSPPTDTGWGVDDILGLLTFKADRASVKKQIVTMCDDGALYSTIDDDHYASTM